MSGRLVWLCAVVLVGCDRGGIDPRCVVPLESYAPDAPTYAEAVAAFCADSCSGPMSQGTCADGKMSLATAGFGFASSTSFYAPSGKLVGITSSSDFAGDGCFTHFYGTPESVSCKHAQSEPLRCPSDIVPKPPACIPGQARCTVSGAQTSVEICMECQQYALPYSCDESGGGCLGYCAGADAGSDAGSP